MINWKKNGWNLMIQIFLFLRLKNSQMNLLGTCLILIVRAFLMSGVGGRKDMMVAKMLTY